MNRYLLGLVFFLSSFVYAGASDDNEINIDQSGDTLTLYIDQVGYGNKIGGDDFSTSSSASTITGSTDSTTMDVDITGDTNVVDLDQGYVSSAERLDLDLTVVGSNNTFDLDIETDDVTWNWDITGSDNNLVSLQNDGFYQEQTVTFNGDNADIDINQLSGTCPVGVTSCKGIITLDITSDDATIQINQKDTSNDS